MSEEFQLAHDVRLTLADVLHAMCDFCGLAQVLWIYPCASFNLIEYGWGSVGDWLTCRECGELIERGAVMDLVVRAILPRLPMPSPEHLVMATEMQIAQIDGFLGHRFGERRLVKAADLTTDR